jgi:hypothetical protein
MQLDAMGLDIAQTKVFQPAKAAAPEKFQSFSISRILSALNQAEPINGTSLSVRYVLPLPGYPIIKIFIRNLIVTNWSYFQESENHW